MHFLNANVWMSLKISLKLVPALVQIMVWRRPGDKQLSEPMMVSLLTHIFVTRSQWVKRNYFIVLMRLFFLAAWWVAYFRWTATPRTSGLSPSCRLPGTISPIPECTCSISHNAPFRTRNVHICNNLPLVCDKPLRAPAFARPVNRLFGPQAPLTLS